MSLFFMKMEHNKVLWNYILFHCFCRKIKDQEELWNYSLERLRDYFTEDLLKDLKVNQEELGVTKKCAFK